MPNLQHWYCGHCQQGPMSIRLDAHCLYCHKHKDSSATYAAASADQTNFGFCASNPTDSPTSGAIPSHLDDSSLSELRDLPPANLQLNLITCATIGLQYPPSNSGGSGVYDFLSVFFPFIALGGTEIAVYCCHCGDGPKMASNQPICVNCNHRICSYCKQKHT